MKEIAAATAQFSDVIGSGGFGKVYRGMLRLEPVAIKVMDEAGLQGEKEFETERSLLSQLRHPHIVTLIGFGKEDTQRCLVYRLNAHGNLERLVRGLPANGVVGPSPSWQQRVIVAQQMAEALAHLHARGVLHRDFKSSNIFLDCNMAAQLGDLGLAAQADREGRAFTRDRDAVGTWEYLDPCYLKSGYFHTSSDVWAMGVCMLEWMTGAAPTRETAAECETALREYQLDSVMDKTAGDWDERVARRVLQLALWCLRPSAAERPTTQVVCEQLQKLVSALPVAAA